MESIHLKRCPTTPSVLDVYLAGELVLYSYPLKCPEFVTTCEKERLHLVSMSVLGNPVYCHTGSISILVDWRLLPGTLRIFSLELTVIRSGKGDLWAQRSMEQDR